MPYIKKYIKYINYKFILKKNIKGKILRIIRRSNFKSKLNNRNCKLME